MRCMDRPKVKRRWYQFSLRWLLIFTTLVALSCALVGRKISRKRIEQSAVEALRKKDAFVLYDYNRNGTEPMGPSWVKWLLGENYLSDVEKVDAYLTEFGDDDLAIVKDLPDLRSLTLNGQKITDEGLANLSELSQLQELWLLRTAISDAGLERLKGLSQLQVLWLESDAITDAGLEHLKGLKKLDDLGLGSTQVTDEGLMCLRGLKQLRKLSLGPTNVTDRGIEELHKALPLCTISR
jgi:hypothetical protein